MIVIGEDHAFEMNRLNEIGIALSIEKNLDILLHLIVTNAMGHAMDLSVPLTVSIGVGRSWFDAAH